jgi:hypothetical protein
LCGSPLRTGVKDRTGSKIDFGKGTASEAAEKLFEGARSSPQALKRPHIFSSLAARLEVVPFPFPGGGDFFRSLFSRAAKSRKNAGFSP